MHALCQRAPQACKLETPNERTHKLLLDLLLRHANGGHLGIQKCYARYHALVCASELPALPQRRHRRVVPGDSSFVVRRVRKHQPAIRVAARKNMLHARSLIGSGLEIPATIRCQSCGLKIQPRHIGSLA